MALTDFSNIVTTGEGPGLTEVGFGTLLCCSYHTHWTERLRTYSSLAEAVDDGFETDEPGYLMLERAFQQKPRPSRVKMGRLANAPVMTQRLTPIPINGATYAITITVEDEDPVDISVTADSSTSTDEVCDALESAINAASLSGITVTPSGGTATHLDVSAAAGLFFAFSDWDPERIKVQDRTPDPGIAADLTAIRTYDSDWYGFAVSVNSAAILEEAADWAETQDVIFCGNTSDWTAHDAGQTVDINTVLVAKSYARSMMYFDLDDQAGYLGVGGLAERLPHDPGAPPGAGGTFHAKTIRGATADALNTTLKTNLQTKGYTVYISTAGRAHTLGGKTPSGEFLDYTRFVDWFQIRLAEKLAAAELNSARIPMSQAGLDTIESCARAQIAEGLASGGINPVDANGDPPNVVMPKISDISQNDRANRILNPPMQISFMYAGAIHKSNVNIFVTK